MSEWQFELASGPFPGPADAPQWDGAGLLFSLPSEARIMRLAASGGAPVESRRYMRVKALAVGEDGTLYGCQTASRRIVRLESDGPAVPLENRLDGMVHNFPQDLTLDRRGRIWFSDSRAPEPTHGVQVHPVLPHAAVLRLQREASRLWRVRRMTFDSVEPQGLLVAADGSALYVADASDESRTRSELRRYPVLGDGSLGEYRVLHTFGCDALGPQRGIDGMCLDSEGNIVACAGSSRGGPGPMVYVFAPTGRVLETHPVPADLPTACAFGDADLGTLYVTTAGGHVFRVRGTGRRGLP